MRISRSRAWAGLAVLATATALPLLTPSTAAAAGSLQGVAEVRNAGGVAPLNSGDSDDAFTLRLPVNSACTGDSAGAGYRVQSYIVPGSVDPASLTFDFGGPIPQGTGANFAQALFDTDGTAYTDAQTANADTPGGPGRIINIPNFNFAIWGPAPGGGEIAPGVYNLGIACTLGPASPTQLKEFWNNQITVTANPSGGPAQISWAVGAVPPAPVLDAVTPGDGSLTVAFTAASSSPATTGFTATATPVGGGTPVTATGAASPITINGLSNGTAYDVTVFATNGAGNGAPSTAMQGTPVEAARPAVENLTANGGAPGSTTLTVDWDAPATGPAPTGYDVSVAPSAGTVNVSGTGATITGLTPGNYTVTVTPTHPAPAVGTPASFGPVSIVPASVLYQEIDVTRPVGALVLTQKCGVALDAPNLGPNGTGGTDPNFGEYPYPVDANEVPNPTYPTYCGVDLGIAKLITSGTGAGQFFRATGEIGQVTVVDTRDEDAGWTVNGTMGDFVAPGGDTFSGSQLGWDPEVLSTTPTWTDSLGNSYTQQVDAGGVIAPNSAVASGLSSARPLALGAAGNATGGGLGIAVLEAALDLLIPVTADNGNYTGLLTITAS